MAQDQNNTNLVTRIVTSHAPSSVVIDSESISIPCFVDEFISTNKDVLMAESIIPVRVDCTEVTDKVSFWRLIATQIRACVPAIFEWDDEAEDEWDTIVTDNNTYFIKESLVSLARIIFEQTKFRFLLIFEQFENALEKMDMGESMKVRNLTQTFVILSVTRSSLRTLGEGKVNNIYYCNQFESFKQS